MNRAKVLIVEDAYLLATQLEGILLAAGHTVVGIAAGERRAIEIAELEAPDLAIVDLKLAKGSGEHTAIQLKARFGSRIILMSGYPPYVIAEVGGRVSPCAILRKPILAEEVEMAVTTCLAQPGPIASRSAASSRPGGHGFLR